MRQGEWRKVEGVDVVAGVKEWRGSRESTAKEGLRKTLHEVWNPDGYIVKMVE